jgi:hypothetical protein
VLELGRIRYMEARSEVPVPHRDRALPLLSGQRAAHLERIAAEARGVEAHVPLTARYDRSLAKSLAQAIERIAQRVTRGLDIGLGPQQRQQTVPGLGPGRFRQHKVEQQGHELRLGEHNDRSAPIR